MGIQEMREALREKVGRGLRGGGLRGLEGV